MLRYLKFILLYNCGQHLPGDKDIASKAISPENSSPLTPTKAIWNRSMVNSCEYTNWCAAWDHVVHVCVIYTLYSLCLQFWQVGQQWPEATGCLVDLAVTTWPVTQMGKWPPPASCECGSQTCDRQRTDTASLTCTPQVSKSWNRVDWRLYLRNIPWWLNLQPYWNSHGSVIRLPWVTCLYENIKLSIKWAIWSSFIWRSWSSL